MCLKLQIQLQHALTLCRPVFNFLKRDALRRTVTTERYSSPLTIRNSQRVITIGFGTHESETNPPALPHQLPEDHASVTQAVYVRSANKSSPSETASTVLTFRDPCKSMGL
ncbi:hypothetical protein BaRGS_00023727 [Batillaria attramentaria]|uniref:Uncharacterized protein n=1 Tax=Batillaria attramentaria TaxID=370345 RepID=A0ABD0KCX9_9CAEN